MAELHPPLEAIEAALFTPSDGLIERWRADDPSLSATRRAALAGNPLAEQRRAVLEAAASEDLADSLPTHFQLDDAAPLPPLVEELIAGRCATDARFADQGGDAEPRPGQLRLITGAVGPEGPLDWDLRTPLAVLLWRPVGIADLWSGWLLAAETDYAGDWDLLLEPEDAPYDPFVAMIQLWNPLQLPARSCDRVIGQLGAERLAAVTAAFTDYLLASDGPAAPAPPRPLPGALMERLTGTGAPILTGTPLGGPDDPRHHYQRLYFAAAGMLRDLAREVIAHAPAPRSRLLDALLDGLRELAGARALVPEPLPMGALMSADAPAPAHPEGAETATAPGALPSAAFRVPGLCALSLVVLADDALANLVKLRLDDPAEAIEVRLLRDGDILEVHQLRPGGPAVELLVEPVAGQLLEFHPANGAPWHWPLTPAAEDAPSRQSED